MTDEIKEVEQIEKPVKVSKKFDLKKWKNRKLQFVNSMTNKAKAEQIAKRVLANK